MKTKHIVWIMIALFCLIGVIAGNFNIRSIAGVDLFLVEDDVDVNVTEVLTARYLNVTEWINASGATGGIDFPDDSIDEAEIEFATACAAGNHLYVDGNDLACEPDADTDTWNNNESVSFFVNRTIFSIMANQSQVPSTFPNSNDTLYGMFLNNNSAYSIFANITQLHFLNNQTIANAIDNGTIVHSYNTSWIEGNLTAGSGIVIYGNEITATATNATSGFEADGSNFINRTTGDVASGNVTLSGGGYIYMDDDNANISRGQAAFKIDSSGRTKRKRKD